MAYIGTTVITSVVAGTDCSGGGTAGIVTIDVDDAFLKNDADDTTSGALTVTGAAGITIKDTTTSSATEGGNLILASDDGAVMADNHRLGVIEFKGAEDTSNTLTNGARIQAIADAAWSASENGASLQFYTTDGNASESVALTLDSDNLATFAGSVNIDSVAISAIQTSGESFADNDTSLMTSASIQDKILAYGYSTTAGDITAVVAGTNLSGGATSGSATITLADASTSAKGAASFNSNHFSTSSGAISLASTITTDGIVFTSANADDPNIEIKNTNTDNQAARLTMRKDPGEAGADADVIAELEFFSVNDAGSPEAQMYGKIVTSIHDATDGQESGDMEIRVATHDGELQEGLKLTGGAAEDEINVTIGGPGATSTTTVSGILEAAKRKMAVSTTTDGNVGSGDIVYFGTGSSVVGKIYHYKSDASWELADANTVANCDGLLAVAIGTDPDVDGMLLRGMVTLIDIQGTEAVGDVLYLSETVTGAADCVAPAGSGDIVRVIGYCLTTDDQIWFNPDNTYVELA